jgi:tetratricopeptide (TPR) repeat protein
VAAGNPLFVEQLLAMLAEGGDSRHVPATIQALLAARLDALPSEERGLLERAAVVGLEFEWDALRELAPDRARPAGAQLATLVRKELIRPHEAIEDAFRFRHMLIRDAAYERIPKALRSELHERFAGWLDGTGEEFDEVIGHHLEQAYRCLVGLGRPGERAQRLGERAAERLVVSGRRAFDRGDTRATVSLLDRAAALLPVEDPRRLGFLPSLGRALREEGHAKRADAVLSEAVERGRRAGEQAVEADARVALSDLRFHRPAQTGVRREDALREIDAAIRVFEELGDEAGMARALTYGGKVRFWGGEAAAALSDLERAARHARDAGDRAQEAESLQYVLTAAHRGPMPVGEALALFAEVRPRTEANRRLGVAFHRSRAHLEAMQGRFEGARASVAHANALAEEHGLDVLLDSHTRPAAGYVELLAEDAAAAERALRPACEGTERVGELGYLSSIAPMLIEAVYLQGRNDEALRLSERWHPERLTVPEDADAQIGWRRVRAKALARRGDFEEAERLVREAVAIASQTDFLENQAQATEDLGEVLQLAGRGKESAAAFHEAMRLCDEKGNTVAARRIRRLLADSPAR